ncbi:alpha/beta fold hydrolase [Candidatus Woesearchaeota archaeon]|nr:alpha/beta fold hydrolase [Candidatus Woesearchaeota archaeon]
MIEEQASFKNDTGQMLHGVFHIPEGKGPFPSVIYLHGYRSDKNSSKILGIIEKLPSCVGFRYDALGHGESEGDFAETTVSTWAQDLNSAIDFVKQQPYVDKKRIGVYGSSLGGMAVLLVASRRNDITCITPICPVSDFKSTTSRSRMTKEENELWKKRGWKPEVIEKKGVTARINYSFYEDGISHNMYAAAEKISCPGLVVHGTADPTVPFQQSVELVKHNKRLALHPVTGADHLFTEDAHYYEVVEVVSSFLRKHLTAKNCKIR